MSLADGQLKNKNLDLTSSAPFAAYLMLRDYELLGSIDDGLVVKGRTIMSFGLTPTNEALLAQPLRAIEADIHGKYDEFENMWLQIPHDTQCKVNFKQFYANTRACFRALDEAIRK